MIFYLPVLNACEARRIAANGLPYGNGKECITAKTGLIGYGRFWVKLATIHEQDFYRHFLEQIMDAAHDSYQLPISVTNEGKRFVVKKRTIRRREQALRHPHGNPMFP